MKYQLEENELLYRICYYSFVPAPNDWMFTSKTLMNLTAAGFDELHISRYKARKYLRSWEQQGLVAKTHYGCQDDDGNVHCYHGYEVTQKLLDTAIGEQAKVDVNKEVQKWINENFESYF
jgi:predicted transcriptional regulator